LGRGVRRVGKRPDRSGVCNSIWRNPREPDRDRNYDLVVDTGRLGVARTVELIETAVRKDGSR